MGSFSPLTREECKVDKGRERMQFFCSRKVTKKHGGFPGGRETGVSLPSQEKNEDIL